MRVHEHDHVRSSPPFKTYLQYLRASGSTGHRHRHPCQVLINPLRPAYWLQYAHISLLGSAGASVVPVPRSGHESRDQRAREMRKQNTQG